MEKTVRNSNHELLRIIAMYMVVLIHANMYLGRFCGGRIWMICNGFVNGICNIGVSVFILISGYYGIRFHIRKLVKMECMMITLSILETGILLLVSPENLRGGVFLEQAVKSLMPFVSSKHWFYSSYICLFLFSGWIHKFMEELSKEQFEKLLLLSVILFNIFPTLFYFQLIPDGGKGFVYMLVVYSVGRYIRMYRDERLPKKAWLLFVLLWLVNGISHEFPIRIGSMTHHLCRDNSTTNLIMAVILFYMFKGINLKSRIINKAASCVFAVFAMNSALIPIAMELLSWSGYQSDGGFLGFFALLGMSFLILLSLLLIGGIRELLLGRLDKKMGIFIEEKINALHRLSLSYIIKDGNKKSSREG